uniref:Uncharacterized protein n=1 Tax=Trypanosoma congolense (strain IL3000) TaxID=1068625 RepID=G0UQ71_TRYCI|nr:conserved hypothetical protein [Trypanosoma congolense IL3000]
MTTNALLSFAVALLLVGPISALAKAGSCFGEASDMTVYPSTIPANNGTSHHTLVFTGDEWEKVKGREGKKLDAALLHDVYEQLLRTHAFNTAVSIDDIDVGNGLEVTLTVVQEPLLSGPEQKLQHMWNPHEVSSLIMQGSFNLTKKLYKKHDFSLGSVRLPIMNGNIYNCGKTCSFLRTVVTLLSLVMAAVIGTTVCFRRKWAREAKKHQDSLAVKAAIDVLGADDDGTQLPGAGEVVIITAKDEEEEALPIPTGRMPLVSNARDGKGMLMHSQVPVPNVLSVDENQGKALAYPHMLAPNVLSVDENQGKALPYPHMQALNVLSVDENQEKALAYPHMLAPNVLSVDGNQGKALPYPHMQALNAPTFAYRRPIGLLSPLAVPRATKKSLRGMAPLPPIAMPNVLRGEYATAALRTPLIAPAGAYTREEELMPLPSVAMPAAPSTEVEKPAAVAPLMNPAGANTREEELMPLPSVAMSAAPSTEVEKPAAVAASSTNNVLNTGSDQVVMLPPDEW